MNLPNKLTCFRLAFIPFILLFLLLDARRLGAGWSAAAWGAATLFFALAALTDWADGAIARARGLETNFGKLMDPLADKVLVASCFIALVEKSLFPAWVVAVILAREFLVTGLRALAIEKGVVMRADIWGKAKTLVQMLTLAAALAGGTARFFALWLGAWREYGAGRGESFLGLRATPMDAPFYWTLFALGLVCAALALASGANYVWKNRGLLADV